MESLAALAFLIFIAILLGAVFGWVSLFRVNALTTRIERLQHRIAALEAGRASPAAEAPPAPAADPVPAPVPEAAPPQPAAPDWTARPQAAPAAAITKEKGEGALARLEASLAGNWLVWVAGLALALGGVFLVRAALDYGLLGPAGRIALAVIAGLAMIGAGEGLRRRPPKTVQRIRSAAPAALAGAGIITIYGAAWAAFGLYALIPAPAAFAALAVIAGLAVALALLHGPVIAAFGMVGALIAPALIGSEEPNAPALFAYVFGVAAASLAVARVLDWRWTGWVAVAGGAVWPLIWLVFGFDGAQAWALAVYLPAYLVAALVFAWDQADEPPPVDRPFRDWWPFPAGLVGAWFGGMAAMALAVLLAERSGHAPDAVLAAGAMSVIALLAAWRREGFAALPAAAAVMAALVVLLWPEDQARLVADAERAFRFMGQPDAGPSTPEFLAAAAGFGALFAVAGWVFLHGLRVKAPMAIAGAGAPVMILAAAYWRMTGLETSFGWSAAAVLVGLPLAVAAWRLVSGPRGYAHAPGAASAYALAPAAAAAIAAGAAFDQLWMSAAFALQALAAAWLWRRAPKAETGEGLGALKIAAAAFGTLAVVRLTVLGEAFGYDVGPWPVLNWLLYGYGVSALALWLASRQLVRGGAPERSRVVQSLVAGALTLGVFLVSMQIRHALHGGRMDAGFYTLLEIGLQTSAWLGAALAIRAALGPSPAFAPRWGVRVLIGLSALHALAVTTAFNPWWGGDPMGVQGGTVFNSLLAAYGVPGALAAALAIVLRRQGRQAAGTITGMIAAVFLFQWLVLEVRFGFHGLLMSRLPVGEAESWAYSALGLVYAGALLALGVVRRRPSLRYAALGLLLAVTVKVFVFDLAGLGGGLRALSFLGLGAVLMAVAALYQRVILPMTRREAEEAALRS